MGFASIPQDLQAGGVPPSFQLERTPDRYRSTHPPQISSSILSREDTGFDFGPDLFPVGLRTD